MKTEKTLTFEEVNAHVEKHFTAKTSEALAAGSSKLCDIYVVVRPILVLISQFPLIPQKWRDVVKGLITVLDGMCPQNSGV
jgi:hypothetical protein